MNYLLSKMSPRLMALNVMGKKREHLKRWNQQRRFLADEYASQLQAVADVHLPIEAAYAWHVYHLYVIRTKERDQLQQFLQQREIHTLIHYPVPIHLQEAYADLRLPQGSFPVTETCVQEILSLPMYPELSPEALHAVCAGIREFFQMSSQSVS